MRRAIVLFLDGLRRDMLNDRWTPNLARHASAAECFAEHRSVFPSATRVVSSSVSTGCFPAKHEMQGNSLILIEDGKLVSHDAGHPDFLQHKRRVTGRSLAMPTMAERLAKHGGARIYANVSPGAAYAHDPDGHGHVYHRAGSFGPGRKPVAGWNAAEIKFGISGDEALTDRFIADAVLGGKPALALLWCAEPDYTQHATPLGSPEHLAVLAAADRNAGRVLAAVAEARRQGDDILLLVGSDHGHQTVSGVVDIDAALVEAGLKDHAGSGDVLSVSNGTSALVYVHPAHADRCKAIGAFLEKQAWAGRVIAAADLASVGQSSRNGLAFAVSMAATEASNAFGIPGMSIAARPAGAKPDRNGCGQHGGLATFEQSPFLLADGAGFNAGRSRTAPSSAVDIAPTVLRHLGVAHDGMDGAPLQALAAP